MIRTLWFYIFFIPASLFFSCTGFFIGFWQKSGRIANWSGTMWSRIAVWASGIKLDVDLSHLPDGNCIIMANHQTQLDIVILYTLLRGRRVGFVAKDSLFRIPIFGQAMLAGGHVPIDRSNRRKAMASINKAMEQAARGVTIIIFPEGTRSTDFSELQDFKIGGFIMALKCELPVVPLIIKGAGPQLPKGRVSFTGAPRTVKVRTLEPVERGGFTLKQREELKDALYRRMNAAYLEM